MSRTLEPVAGVDAPLARGWQWAMAALAVALVALAVPLWETGERLVDLWMNNGSYGHGILILPTTGRYFHLPYRTLLPKGVENLVCAGRITGGDKVSHAATRNMMCCTVTGQGAGVAAALSVKHNRAFGALDVGLLQKELLRQGVRLH